MTAAALDAVDAAVVVFVDGQVPLSNDCAGDLLRRSGWELPTRAGVAVPPAPRVFRPDRTTPEAEDGQALVRASRGVSFGRCVQWVGAPGDQIGMLCSASEISPSRGGHGIVFVAWDATELLQPVQALDDHLATAAHELRTPLTSILGHLELYEDAARDEADALTAPGRLHHLIAARRNAETLGRRIENLLQVTRPSPEARVVDLPPLFAQAVSNHGIPASSAGLTLSLQAPEVLWTRVDPTALEQVLDNLVGNAVKYTRQGTVTIVLAADAAEHLVGAAARGGTPDAPVGFRFEVTDTGEGMSEQECLHAFDRFYRGRGTRRATVPGLGIGLAVVEHLVEVLGGSVHLVSQPRVGTSVAVRVPLAPAAPPGDRASGGDGA